jgi:hypothetical protein
MTVVGLLLATVSTGRWIVTWFALIVWALCAFFNCVYVILNLRGRHCSLAPFVGGFSGFCAAAMCPNPQVRPWLLLTLLEPGSLPMLILWLISIRRSNTRQKTENR